MKFIDQTAKTNYKFLAIVVIAGLIAGVVSAWHIQSSLEAIRVLRSDLLEHPIVVSHKSSKIDISTWQTYRNDEFGFELKYPQDWNYAILGTPDKNIMFAPQSIITNAEEPLKNIKNDKFLTLFVTFYDEFLFRAILQSRGESNEIQKTTSSTINVDGIQVNSYVSEFIKNKGNYQTGDKTVTVDLPIKDGYLSIHLFDYQYVNIFNKILATFRFVDAEPIIQRDICERILETRERAECWFYELKSIGKTVETCTTTTANREEAFVFPDSCYSRIAILVNDVELCEEIGLYAHGCKIGVAEQNPFYPPEEAKAIIAERANVVVRALKEKDMEKLASFVHPQKPLRFWSINAGFELSKEKISSFFIDQTVHMGAYDGSGRPFTFTQAEYYEDYIYDRDYLNAPQVSYDLRYMSSATTGGGQFDSYHAENPIVVTYAFPQSSDEAGADWRNLRLWFTEESGVWYLREIMQNQWAI